MQIVEKGKCTGCGVCKSGCPVKAIELVEDEKGFWYPHVIDEKCISCGRCQVICPACNPLYNNSNSPEIYAFSSEEENMKHSSSGGLFSILSEIILDEGGVVVGAAWADNFRVEHIIIRERKEIIKLNFSKYIQSETDGIYEKVKNELEAGRKVLFSGCPCQVAAIKSYIGENRNLFTVDILCHGVPSSQMLCDHLRENYGIEEIDEVCFRVKDGWDVCFDVFFKDGTKQHRRNSEDEFMTGFLNNFTIRKSCCTCAFARIPRQGDVTIGDLWGAYKMNLNIPWKKGISAVLVNSVKGKELFDCALNCKEHEIHIQDIKDKAGLNGNIFSCRSINKYEGGYFEKNYKGGSFDKGVVKTMHDYDIGLVQYVSGNYGSIATSVGITSLLLDLNRKVVLLDNVYPISEMGKRVLGSIADLSSSFLGELDYEGANKLCDTFVVGSDMSWYLLGQNALERNHALFLGFTDSSKKTIAIAPCTNYKRNYFSKRQKALVGHYLNRIDYISVREKISVDILKQDFGINAKHLMDPVFLCDSKYYKQLADKAEDKRTGHIFAYILDPTPEKRELLLKAKAQLGKELVVVLDAEGKHAYGKKVLDLGDAVKGKVSFEQWLAYIKNADAVITDSYHGACLSLILHRPFAAIYNRMFHRFETLEGICGFSDAFGHTVEELENRDRIIADFKWDKIDANLDESRSISYEWVKNAIEGPKKEKADDSHILANIIKDLLKEDYDYKLNELKKNGCRVRTNGFINRSLDAGKNVLESIRGFNELSISEEGQAVEKALVACENVKDYFELVREKGCLVVIAGQDSCNVYFDKFVEQAGISIGKKPKFRESYIMLTQGYVADFEDTKLEDEVRYKGMISIPQKGWDFTNSNNDNSKLMIYVSSLGFKGYWGINYSSILINNIDYSCGGRGINGVVISSLGDVVDSWNIDLYDDEKLEIRRNIKRG